MCSLFALGTAAAQVANDDPTTATALGTSGAGVAGTLAGATASGYDQCDDPGYVNDDVFYSFVAPAGGEVHVSFGDLNDDAYDAGHGLLEATGSGSGTGYACHGRGDYLDVPFSYTGLTAGQTYYLQVYAFDVGASAAAFTVYATAPSGLAPPAPANDACADAITLAVGTAQTGTTIGATEASDPLSATDPDNCVDAGVWYAFVGTGGAMTVTAQAAGGSGADLDLQAFTGDCGDLRSVRCAEGARDLTFVSLAGETYRVLVGAPVGVAGQTDFSIDLTAAALDPVATGTLCTAGDSEAIAAGDGRDYSYVSFRTADGRLIAKVEPSQNLGTAAAAFYTEAGAVRTTPDRAYADRNVLVRPASLTPPPTRVRLYFTAAEVGRLLAADPSGSTATELLVRVSDESTCGAVQPPTVSDLVPLTVGQYGADYFYEVSTTQFGQFFLTTPANALPLGVRDVRAAATASGARVRWTAPRNSDAEAYAVQVSADGNTYTPVAEVPAERGRGGYEATDVRVRTSAYYRVIARARSGETFVSDAVYLTRGRPGAEFAIYPNPAHAQLHVQAESGTQVEMMNALGRVVGTGEVDEAGLTLPVGEFSRGTYLVRTTDPGGEVRSRRVVLR